MPTITYPWPLKNCMYALGFSRRLFIFVQEPKHGKTRSHSSIASRITFLALSKDYKKFKMRTRSSSFHIEIFITH